MIIQRTDLEDQLLLDGALLSVLESLERGFLYAKHLNCDTTLFATPGRQLLCDETTLMDLRWLILAGHIETSTPVNDDAEINGSELIYLTEAGFEKLQSLPASPNRRVAAAASSSDLPTWCGSTRRLMVGRELVKAFRVPSPNQINVLQVFEEEGWPLRIDDPLPPRPGIATKRRLVETIKSLNRSQKEAKIRFFGDGTGVGVCWRYE